MPQPSPPPAFAKVKIARSAGFCPGVRSAVDRVFSLAREARERGERVFTLGQLIHNADLVEELSRMGVRALSPEDLPALAASLEEDGAAPVTLVVRTHGIPRELAERLAQMSREQPRFKLVDCTCPFVSKIHRIAEEETRGGDALVVFGDPAHPEVAGTVSFAHGDAYVCSSPMDIPPALARERERSIVVVAQTTEKVRAWEDFKAHFRRVIPGARFFDTICTVTETRQRETSDLARACDLVLVVGGRESANTRGLLAVAQSENPGGEGSFPRAYLVEGARDAAKIPREALSRARTIGITAGASTPDRIIQEVTNLMSDLQNSENFAEMLAESFKTLKNGDRVKGTIVAVTPNELRVDIGAKETGIIPFDEITDDSSVKLEEKYHVGDEVEAVAWRVSDLEGVAVLSIRRAQKIINWQKIKDAYENGGTIEGKVVEEIKGGLIADCMLNRVFIPMSLSGVRKGEDPKSLIGQTVRFKIKEIDESRTRATGDIRAALYEERKKHEQEFWDEIDIGKRYHGKVRSLTEYGAFVDLGPVDGMVHVSEISWKRVNRPSDVVKIGDELDVMVKDFDRDRKRISLTCKTPESDPWQKFTERFSEGDTVEATVVNLAPFGAFAELMPGQDGLIHISQIADHKIAHPSDVLKIGDKVRVKIIGIDPSSKRVSLSMRAVMEDEAMRAAYGLDDLGIDLPEEEAQGETSDEPAPAPAEDAEPETPAEGAPESPAE